MLIRLTRIRSRSGTGCWLRARGEGKGKGSESDGLLYPDRTHPSKTGKSTVLCTDWGKELGTSSFSSIMVWPYFCDLIPSQALLGRG